MFDSMIAFWRRWLKIGFLCLTIGCIGGYALVSSALEFPGSNAGGQNQAGSEAAQKPPAELATSPYAGLTQQQVEEFLLKAKVLRTKDLAVGITNSKRATLNDGQLQQDAHIQTIDISKHSFETVRGTEMNFRDSYNYNIAAYELDKLLDLNMVPPSVKRRVEGHEASVTWWINDTMMEHDRLKKKIQPPDINQWNRQMNMMHVFDQLIYNTDPNQGNILIAKDWKVWLIDHTRAFRWMKDLQNPKVLVMCDRNFLSRLRELNIEVLRNKLKPYLTNPELDGLVSRRDLIVKFFDEKVARLGEKAALFD